MENIIPIIIKKEIVKDRYEKTFIYICFEKIWKPWNHLKPPQINL